MWITHKKDFSIFYRYFRPNRLPFKHQSWGMGILYSRWFLPPPF